MHLKPCPIIIDALQIYWRGVNGGRCQERAYRHPNLDCRSFGWDDQLCSRVRLSVLLDRYFEMLVNSPIDIAVASIFFVEDFTLNRHYALHPSFPYVAVCIGISIGKVVQVGVVYNPVLDEVCVGDSLLPLAKKEKAVARGN